MDFFDGIKRQLRSVIEWKETDSETLLYQWTDNGDEIKNASKLIVGPGQGCIFVYQGRIRQVLQRDKMVSLKTDNIPFWTTISRIMQSFESEHKVGLFFFRTSKILNQKWGTTSEIKYEDPKYKFPVGLKLYGNYSYRIKDPRRFFVDVVGHNNNYYADDFRAVMSNRLIQPITDFLSESRFSYTEIDANRDEITNELTETLNKDFDKLGFEITDFRIEGTDFDDDTLRRINRIADLTAENQAAEAVNMSYAGLQQMEAMREAARNEGGAAGIGMGLGAGMGFGQIMANSMDMGKMNMSKNEPAPSSPNIDNKSDNFEERLAKLKKLRELNFISEEDYNTKKASILSEL